MNPHTGEIIPLDVYKELSQEERDDLVEVFGTRSQVESMSRSIQQARATERRRAKNKVARRSRRRSR